MSSTIQRNTPQSQAILKCYQDAGRPLAPIDAHTRLSATHPRLGIATVYRAVRRFELAGLLERVEVDGVAHYEHPKPMAHPHFVCENCRQSFCLPPNPDMLRTVTPPGFSVKSHDLLVRGHCPRCQESTPCA